MKPTMRFWCAITVLLAILLSLVSCGDVKEERFGAVDLTWAIGAVLPEAEDYFPSLPEGDSVSFAEEIPYAGVQSGENEILLLYKPSRGRRREITVKLTLIRDVQPPVIHGVRDIAAYVGEGVAYRTGITLTDNCGGTVTLNVDSSAVDTSREGVYPVFYEAIDLAGNRAYVESYVHVYLERITAELLYSKIDPIIAELGLIGLSKVEQARRIYQFVHTDAHITYVDTSDKTDWMREAYFCLLNRRGDCFSYFALSKAFFERLGIENLDVQRTKGFTEDTHFWSMINVAEAGERGARWYHYDATRLRDVSYSGCLLTDSQVDAFSRLRQNFYLYDRTGYPATATEILTPRPDLE
ncbi:MAG: hypothetical protein E7620_09415 [Ruminococcaceae bacterium]|nr:hypothetical protein [Oscillospiraceae bacterium]